MKNQPISLENYKVKQEDQVSDSFVRIEDKFVVSKQYLNSLKEVISSHLDASYIDTATHFTMIESLYFDSEKLDLYQNHFTKNSEKRSKMRIRRYGPNGKWSAGVAFIEAKSKANGVCTKQRFKISQDDYARLQAGKTIEWSEELIALNYKTTPSQLRQRVGEINEMITTYNLRPQLSLVYKRLAFEKGNLRMTIDEDINYTVLNDVSHKLAGYIKHQNYWEKASTMKNKFSNENLVLLEVKHAGSIPEWFGKLSKDLSIEKGSFSKYCWGMTRVVSEI